MEKIGALYVGFLLLLLIDSHVAATDDFGKVNETDVTAGLDQQLNNKTSVKENGTESDSKLVSDQIDLGKKKEGDKLGKLKNGVGNGEKTNVSDNKNVTKEDGNVNIGKDLAKNGGDKNGKNSKSDTRSEKVPKPKSIKGTGGDLSNQKEDSGVEKCAPSNMCVDSEDKMVACLRVPGDESPEFSLLIQNIGEDLVDVTITAPGSVQLEKTNIQLPGKQNMKVKVFVTDGAGENLIILRGRNGYCNLEIKDLVAHKFGKELQNSHKSMPFKFLSRTSSLTILSFAVLLILASGWMCVSFRKKQLSSNNAKYERLDMELPVTCGGKTLTEINDGWEESWGDDWDDEEAPKTPSMPVTPNLSSKGLASRRLSKEGWKD